MNRIQIVDNINIILAKTLEGNPQSESLVYAILLLHLILFRSKSDNDEINESEAVPMTRLTKQRYFRKFYVRRIENKMGMCTSILINKWKPVTI